MFDSCEIRVHPTGTAIARLGTISQGQGHATTFAQILASELGIPAENITVEEGDTDAISTRRKPWCGPCATPAITLSTISSRRLGTAALRPKPTPGSGPYCVHALRRRGVGPQQAFVFQLRPERRRNRVTECGNVLPHVFGR
jgi:hypothetical protein